MQLNCCSLEMEITASELRQQVDYTRTVCNDLFKLFSSEKPDPDTLIIEYHAIRTKLSMMLDFLFQANLWCNNLDKQISKEEK